MIGRSGSWVQRRKLRSGRAAEFPAHLEREPEVLVRFVLVVVFSMVMRVFFVLMLVLILNVSRETIGF